MGTTLYVRGRGLLWPILREKGPEPNQAVSVPAYVSYSTSSAYREA